MINQESEIMVSVICYAYNHEKYIRKCLDGFLMQKTDFAYEIIISDDASTDRTAEIIREYEKNFSVIIPVYYEVNQFSIGQPKRLLERARGKYIAICEGDDYWIDEHKLQRQIEILESNKQISACCSNQIVVTENEVPYGDEIQKLYRVTEDIIQDVSYLNEQCKFSHTASLIFRKEIFDRMTKEEYEEYLHLKVNGDIMYAALLSVNGDIYHESKDTACYRYVTHGGDSWSARNAGKNYYPDIVQQLLRIKEYIKKYYDKELSYQNYIDELTICAILFSLKYHGNGKQECKQLWDTNPNKRLLACKLLKKSVTWGMTKVWRSICGK